MKSLPKSQPGFPKLLVIIRHGQSVYNEERELVDRNILKTYSGNVKDTRNPDLPLSNLGKQQAENAARFLQKEYKNFDYIFYSPFVRAKETAEIILRKFAGAEFRVEERIREKEFGVVSGLTPEEFKSNYPSEYERKTREGKYYYRPIGGESFPDLNLRTWSFATTIVREYSGKKILIVCHSTVILSFRRLFEKLTEQELLEIDRSDDIRNCAIVSYRLNTKLKPKPKLQLEYYNKTG